MIVMMPMKAGVVVVAVRVGGDDGDVRMYWRQVRRGGGGVCVFLFC